MPLRSSEHLMPRSVLRVGTTIRGKYHLDDLLGVGGMAAVYSATHRNGGRFALKVLHQRMDDAGERSAFLREARIANQVGHPGALNVLDEDVADDGTPFLVMPLLEGETLRARWERHEKRLPPREVAGLAYVLLDVLAAAHRNKIVHRDIKPENLFLTTDGQLRVLDFGIARLLEAPPGAATRAGRSPGTPQFMAPEQARGRGIDGQTDVWAVGATMLTLLAGRYVHHSESADEAVFLAATEAAPPVATIADHVPVALCEVVDRALALQKEDRWPDASAMRAALRTAYATAFAADIESALADVRGTAPTAIATVGVHFQETHASTARLGDEALPHPATSPGIPSQRPRRIEPAAALVAGAAAATRTNTGTVLPVPVVPTRGHRPFVIAAAALVSTLIAVAGWRAARHLQPVPLKSLGVAASRPDPKVLKKHLAAANSAWLAGRPDESRAEARAALEADDSPAEAWIQLVRSTSLWPEQPERETFVRAQDSREALSVDDRAYLEALAPGMSVPADFPGQAARLEKLHAISPAALPVTVALADSWMRINRSGDAVSLLRPLAQQANAPALILATFGRALASHDDLHEAVSTLSSCVSNYPAAIDCLDQLEDIYLVEGACAEAERAARKEISSSPRTVRAYLRMAYALDAEGAPVEEVQHVLDKCVELMPPEGRPLLKAQLDLQAALARGRFKEALELDSRFAATVRTTSADSAHFDYTNRSIQLKAELGMNEEAASTLRDYVASRQRLQRDNYGGDNVMYINGVATMLGLIPWSSWIPMRAGRLATHMDRDDLQDGPQRSWLEYFAVPARDVESSKEALDALPRYLPILHASDRWPLHDGAIGNVLSLAGRSEEATAHFQRAAASCTRLENPTEYQRALMYFGAHLERIHKIDEACAVYRRILVTWPRNSGSSTASAAGNRVDAVCRESR